MNGKTGGATGTLPLPSTHRTVPSKSRIGKTRNRFRHRPLAQAKGFCCATKQAALRNGIPVSDPKKTGILIVLLHNLQDKSSASRSWKSKSNRGSFVSIFWFQLPTTDDYRLTTNDPPLFSIFKNQLKAPSEFQFCQGHSFQIPTIGKMTCKRGDTITSTPIMECRKMSASDECPPVRRRSEVRRWPVESPPRTNATRTNTRRTPHRTRPNDERTQNEQLTNTHAPARQASRESTMTVERPCAVRH